MTISTRLDEAGPHREDVVGGHRRRRLVALAEEDDAEQDQHDAGDQGPDDQATAGQAGDALGAARGDPHAGPVHDDDDGCRPHATAGQLGIEDVRERAGHEPEQARVVEDRHRELAPHGQEAHRLRDPLRHPLVDAALPAGRQLGRHQRRRQQEDDGGEEVQEHAGEAVDGHRRRRAQAGHRAGGHHREGHPRDVGGRRHLGTRRHVPRRHVDRRLVSSFAPRVILITPSASEPVPGVSTLVRRLRAADHPRRVTPPERAVSPEPSHRRTP